MSDTTSISVEITHPPLPEGWEGTPQELTEWQDENAQFSASGAFLTGQIGGTRPTTNIGIFVNGQYIEVWRGGSEGKYVPLLTVPIGAILDWPALSQAPPDNYLFAEGQVLTIADYQDLADVLGRAYVRTTDTLDQFRLPDLRGRVAVGAGDAPGDVNPRDPSKGVLLTRNVGDYFGSDGPTYKVTAPFNGQVPRYSVTLQGASTSKPDPFAWNKTTFNGIQPPSLGVRKIIRFK